MDKTKNRIKDAILNRAAARLGRTALTLGVLANVCGTGFAALDDSAKNPIDQENAAFQYQHREPVNDRPSQTNPHAVVDRKAVGQSFNSIKPLKDAYLAVANNTSACDIDTTSTCAIVEKSNEHCAREINSISCYQVLVNAFNATGQDRLLGRMQSNSNSALNEFYSYLMANTSLGEKVKMAFYTLVNTLNMSKLKINEYYHAVENKWENNDRFKLQLRAHDTYVRRLSCLNTQYNLTEILNFTINYVVYGVGLENIDTTLLSTYFNHDFIQKQDTPITGCLESLMRLVTNADLASKSVSQVRRIAPKGDRSCIIEICDAIDNCINNSNLIQNTTIDFYDDSEYMFQTDENGFGDTATQIKAINFVERLLESEHGTTLEINSGTIMSLSNMIGLALYGDAKRYSDKFQGFATYKPLVELREAEELERRKIFEKTVFTLEEAKRMLKLSKNAAPYKELLNGFNVNSRDICFGGWGAERHHSLLFLAVAAKKCLPHTTNVQITSMDVTRVLEEIKNILNNHYAPGTDNSENGEMYVKAVADLIGINDLHDILRYYDERFSKDTLLALIDHILNKETRLEAFTRIVS